MKKALLFAAIFCCFVASAFTQATPPEQEVATFANKLREAGRTNDVAFFETALAPEYIYSNPYGTTEDRAAVIDYFRKLKET
ncbi:MAG: nuclear transport factor 2 family protein, partial [bacterium]|nr:nuclear transport factor 2 family protein [bacterium]